MLALPASGGARHSYSCGLGRSGAQPHCYGLVHWAAPRYYGAGMTLRTVSIVSPARGREDGNFVDNELWLVDASPTCASSGFRACWVETGYMSNFALPGEVNTFWAQGRPDGTLPVHFIVLTPMRLLPSPFYTSYEIIQRTGSSFRITICCLHGVTNGRLDPRHPFVAEVTDLPITPNRIDMGQELAGAGGGSAPRADYRYPMWWDALCASGTPDEPSGPLGAVRGECGDGGESRFRVQDSDGTVVSSNPPAAGWLDLPSRATLSPGGEFVTQCCSEADRIEEPRPAPVEFPFRQASPTDKRLLPIGLPAVKPHLKGLHTFTVQDAVRWVRTHPLPKALGEKLATAKGRFVTEAAVRKLVGDGTGLPSRTSLCYLELTGRLFYAGPPGTKVVRFERAFAVFNARTGNLLLAGGLGRRSGMPPATQPPAKPEAPAPTTPSPTTPEQTTPSSTTPAPTTPAPTAPEQTTPTPPAPPPVTECSDGKDNDGDGLVDLKDPDCTSAQGKSEGPPPQCSDKIDNDKDGAVDFPADKQCTGPTDDDESA